jgi:uncharacterized membrane protein (DUF373 family)
MKNNGLKLCNGDNCTPVELTLMKRFDNLFHTLTFLLIVAVVIILFKQLYSMFVYELFYESARVLIDSILFLFILLELYTILIQYLRKGYIKVERIVEVGIIAVVKELMFHISDLNMNSMIGISSILLSLGALFYIEKHFSKQRNA